MAFYVYILTNKAGSVLYTGVTNDLKRRVWEHKGKFVPSFTKKYNVTSLVHYEQFEDIFNAREREKQIKGGSRAKKLALINASNPHWTDLYDEI